MRSYIPSIVLLLTVVVHQTIAADSYFAITPVVSGVNNLTDQRPFRKDINELNGPELHLYLQALGEVHQAVQTDKLSWFQVAGIHGYPPVSWDRVPPYDRRTPYPGYAVHNCESFLPWHRAYLLLVENLISRKAREIANRYTPELRDQYIKAANNLRLPYWAWEGPTPELPYLVKTRDVSIVLPSGVESIIRNPIEAYSFHPPLTSAQVGGDVSLIFNVLADVVANLQPKFSNRPETNRQPDAYGRTEYAWVQGNWTLMWPSSRSMIFDQLVQSGSSFRQFAFSSGSSLELIHGNLHVALGGFMYNLYTSSFDPAFFLHHANVDRLWAIWAAIHPNSYMTGGNTCWTSTYAQRGGFDDNENSPLYPFHKDTRGSLHTPRSVRDIKNLGYAFKQIPDWQFSDPAALSDHVLGVVQSSSSDPAFRVADGTSGTAKRASQRWTIDFTISLEKETAVTVYFFLGAAPAQRDQWTLDNNLIFAQALLRSQVQQLRSASIPITTFLSSAVKQNKLTDLSAANVEPYLARNLQWKVIVQGGSAAQNQLADQNISVKVVEQKIKSAQQHGLIEVGPGIVHANLTWAAQQNKQDPGHT